MKKINLIILNVNFFNNQKIKSIFYIFNNIYYNNIIKKYILICINKN